MTWIGGVIVSVFVLGLLIGNWLSGKRQQPEAYDAHADKLDYPTQRDAETSIASLARAQIAAAKDRQTSDKQTSAYYERSHRVGFWTAIGVGIYTAITAVILGFAVMQYKVTLRQSDDIERQSTSGRAYLFVDYPFQNEKVVFDGKNATGSLADFYASIILSNISTETPGIVTNIDAKLFQTTMDRVGPAKKSHLYPGEKIASCLL
jgi:hypothetical protein